MILFGVMSFVENKQIDLIHSHVRVQETLVQYLCCANYHHVRLEILVPGLFAPKVCSHGAKELGDILVDVVAQNSSLLVYESNTVHLESFQLLFPVPLSIPLTRKNEIRCGLPAARSFSSL